MKYFLITYTFQEGSEEAWQTQIESFISNLKNDEEVGNKVTYRCLKSLKSSEYFHLATVADDATAEQLGKKEFFQKYTEQIELVSKGSVKVTPLALLCETE